MAGLLGTDCRPYVFCALEPISSEFHQKFRLGLGHVCSPRLGSVPLVFASTQPLTSLLCMCGLPFVGSRLPRNCDVGALTTGLPERFIGSKCFARSKLALQCCMNGLASFIALCRIVAHLYLLYVSLCVHAFCCAVGCGKRLPPRDCNVDVLITWVLGTDYRK